MRNAPWINALIESDPVLLTNSDPSFGHSLLCDGPTHALEETRDLKPIATIDARDSGGIANVTVNG